jgi:ferrous iron transport protein B
MQSFDLRLALVENPEDSILASIARIAAPLMAPAGLGDWRICVSLVSGFIAKESVVSTLKILFSGDVAAFMSPLTAASLLVFSLLYTPCVAAIASIRREMGSKWAFAVIIWQCVVAWIVALIIFLIMGAL